MSSRWSKSGAPFDRCPKCGWEGRDWQFKYGSFCSKCHKKWRRGKAEELKALRPPDPPKPKNDNIEVSEGLIVTRNVRDRLQRRAQSETPHSAIYYYAGIIEFPIFFVPLIIAAIILCLFSIPDVFILIIVSVSLFLGVGGMSLFELIKYSEAGKRNQLVLVRVEGLARNRQKAIDEMLTFYASPEWRLARGKIIQEQGRICKECKEEIKDDFDLTVDHIKPRSKFPGLALDVSNLRVLCRSCNSSKGSAYEEAGDILVDLGRNEEACKLDQPQKQHEFSETAILGYNQGCLLAYRGNKQEALKKLTEAIKLDAKLKDKAKKDGDFKTLWDDEEFKRLVS